MVLFLRQTAAMGVLLAPDWREVFAVRRTMPMKFVDGIASFRGVGGAMRGAADDGRYSVAGYRCATTEPLVARLDRPQSKQRGSRGPIVGAGW